MESASLSVSELRRVLAWESDSVWLSELPWVSQSVLQLAWVSEKESVTVTESRLVLDRELESANRFAHLQSSRRTRPHELRHPRSIRMCNFPTA